MKIRLLIIIGMFVFSLVVPQGFAACATNEDWPDAPCLDTTTITCPDDLPPDIRCLDVITNGCKSAEGVGKWSEYYYFKGSSLMETKKSDMLDAFDNGVLEEWLSKSHENSNVWRYYYLKGEIPDSRGEYYNIDKCISALHIPGNPFWSIPYSSWIILVLLVGIPSMIIVRFWRKRK